MKLLIIPFLLITSCASDPQPALAPTHVPEAPAPSVHEASSEPTDLATGVTSSPSELAALQAQEEYLEEMAAAGIYPETAPTQITVKYHRSGLTIGLYNESYISQSEYYQQKRNNAVYKVVPDIKMGALIKALEDLDFFAEAQSVSIIFRRGNESFSLAWGPEVNVDLHEVTSLSGDSIRLMYDTTRSIQVVDNVDGADYFQQESDRINQQNAQRRSKPRQ